MDATGLTFRYVAMTLGSDGVSVSGTRDRKPRVHRVIVSALPTIRYANTSPHCAFKKSGHLCRFSLRPLRFLLNSASDTSRIHPCSERSDGFLHSNLAPFSSATVLSVSYTQHTRLNAVGTKVSLSRIEPAMVTSPISSYPCLTCS